MKTYDAVAAALLDHGVDTLFGLMGDANLRYAVAYCERGGRFVAAVHEGGAVGMADAWARVTGRIGVVSVTHGPALTNTLTSLVEATRQRTPMVVLTADTPREPTHLQRIDIGAVAVAAGAGHDRVYRTATVVRDLNRAFQRAVAERRPIVVDLPVSLLRGEAGTQVPVRRPVPPSPAAPDADTLDRALGLLAASARPVVLAGRGAVLAGARDELVALADRVGAVLGTTLLAKDLFAGEPADIGICGSLAHDTASGALGEADCIVAFGASLNLFTTLGGSLAEGRRIVQVDADPGAFGSFLPVDEAVAGDARVVAASMVAALDGVGHEPRRGWRGRVEESLRRRSVSDEFVDTSAGGTVDVRTAMVRLDALLPGARTVVSDVGRYVVGVWPYVHVADPRHFVSMGAFGSIGLGLAGAVGASLATPGQVGVALLGDGGFMMASAELTTAVREKVPLVVVVLDDGAYGAEHHKLARWGVDPSHSLTDWPELALLARAIGARALTVRRAADLDVLPGLLTDLDGPLLVDVRLDPAHDLM